MVEKLSAVKFVSGYNITGFAKAFAIGSKIAIIVSLGWFIWTGAIQPHTKWRVASTTQKAEQIINNTYNPESKSLIEFKLWFIKVKVF